MQKNLTGYIFGQWTVIKDSGGRVKDSCGNSRVKWLCKCSCGEIAYLTTRSLTSGRSTKCSRCAQRKYNPIKFNENDTVSVTSSNGIEFIIDKESLVLINQYYWYVDSSGHVTSNTQGKRKSLSRIILGFTEYDFLQVDHISGDPLDNRICNLRLCDALDNSRNRPIRSDNLTGYKGVTYRKNGNKYIARISPHPGERLYLGKFDNPKDAAAAYDRAAILYHGEFARTNHMMGVL